jgi:hypothetical protein
MTKHYDTLHGLKRAAVKLKREKGCSHSQALELVAREAGFASYHDAHLRLGENAKLNSLAISKLTTGRRLVEGNFEILEMSPELAAAFKHQRDLDIAESGPQAPEPEIDHSGVIVSSRYGLEHELTTMSRILDALPDGARDRIEMIWCDSAACACYDVTIRRGQWHNLLPDLIRETTLLVAHGFNMLMVEGDSHHVSFDPEWGDDEYL